MPTPRLYESGAERQRAYRERLEAAARPIGGSLTEKLGKVNGRALARRGEAQRWRNTSALPRQKPPAWSRRAARQERCSAGLQRRP